MTYKESASSENNSLAFKMLKECNSYEKELIKSIQAATNAILTNSFSSEFIIKHLNIVEKRLENEDILIKQTISQRLHHWFFHDSRFTFLDIFVMPSSKQHDKLFDNFRNALITKIMHGMENIFKVKYISLDTLLNMVNEKTLESDPFNHTGFSKDNCHINVVIVTPIPLIYTWQNLQDVRNSLRLLNTNIGVLFTKEDTVKIEQKCEIEFIYFKTDSHCQTNE